MVRSNKPGPPARVVSGRRAGAPAAASAGLPCRLLALLLWTALSARAAANSLDDYLVKNWTTADGVPHNTVRTVIQSRDGYLWMGTANGLARFDGVRFVVFNLANTPGLVSDDIFSMHEDRQGALWLRTRRGLARWREGRFEFLSLPHGGPPSALGNFAEDTDGRLWVRGGDGFARWTGTTLERVALPTNGPARVDHICAAPDGGLWLAAGDGLWRFRDGRASLVQPVSGLQLVAAAGDGRVWGLVGQRRLFVLSQGTWTRVADFGVERCTSLYAAPNGDVWVGSDQRNVAFRLRAGRVTELNGENGLEGNRVLCFVQDHDGNVWLGLNAGGLFRLRERRVQLYDRRDGFEGLNISSVGQTAEGTIMANVMGSTLHRFEGGRFEALRVDAPPEVFQLPTALMPARSGGVWAGTFYGSLPRIQNNHVVERLGSTGGTRALFTDREGNLWRGMRTGGIEVFTGNTLTRFTTNEGLSFNNVYCFAQDRAGAVWAGTEQGLNRIERGRITRFGPADGLGNQFVSSLCADSRGTIWAGTLGGGLSAWNGTRFITLTTREGLAHDAVDQVIEDDHGCLWLATRAGLLRLPVAQLHDYLAGKVRVVTGTLIGRDEGLARANFWTEYQPAALKARDGRLWFCTGSGMIVIDPRRFEAAAAAPLVHVEELMVDGELKFAARHPPSEVIVGPGRERVEIRYTGISPAEPAQVRFRYRLAGYDRDWVEAGRARFASYSHLPPGRYEFRVQAVNNDGVWNETGASLGLVVQPTFWQTRWFRGGLALLFVAGVFAAYRTRIAQLERRRAAQEAFSRQLIDSQEQERKRITAELHDSLGQNLLVVRNLALMGTTAHAADAPATRQFKEISEAAAQALSEVRSISRALRPVELDRLGLTKAIQCAVQRAGESSGLRFDAEIENVDRLLPPASEISLYRIVQECLNNIIKHAGATGVAVELRRAGNELQVAIADDGRGFDPGSSAAGTGTGLAGIVERARTMNGSARIQSRPGGGTRVEVTLPVRRI